MFGLFKKKSLQDALVETKKVKIQGVLFELKKIDSFDYANGSSVMREVYSSYSVEKKAISEVSQKKIKDHYRDVFMSGVVKPLLTRKPDEEGVFVDDLFKDQFITDHLYKEIVNFTYSKKKRIFNI